jgi:hypothetical protein
MDLTVFKSLPHDIIARAAAAVVGLFFVRDGIYALQGKLMAGFMFLLSWYGFD